MICRATKEDGLQIQDIAARAGVFSEEEVDAVRVMWSEYLSYGEEESGYHFLVYRDEQRVLGFAIYGPRDLTDGVFDLYWIAVDPSVRRNSVGRKLLHACEDAVRTRGGRILVAETSGTPLYDSTRQFYFGMGYQDEAKIKDFYKVGDDLVIFTKRV